MRYSKAIKEKCVFEITNGKSLEEIFQKYRVNRTTLGIWKREEFTRIANDDSITVEMLDDDRNKKTKKIKRLNQKILVIEAILKLKGKLPIHNPSEK
ncbi:hypothetical protein [Acinetobacter terrae]|uniref:Transposase n=1 Tax=Acinetobacter terrae TaxID=2731247 RepID=A0ABX1V4A9_9GAMM|nr:hypothetical protein [Acinetobacter terrae]NNH87949.1 hypothetical protein [Acinetobacter terrae]